VSALNETQRQFLQTAVNKVEAILNGTLRDGTGGTDPTDREIVVRLMSAQDDIHTVVNWMRQEMFEVGEAQRKAEREDNER
jgi:hypothetical protein